MDYRSEMAQLRQELNEAGYRYYVLDDPTMSDYASIPSSAAASASSFNFFSSREYT